MPLAKNKWRRHIAVLLCAMLVFSTAFSVTAFADNAVVTSGSMYSYFQIFSSKGQWVDVMTPSHWITDTGEVAYCLQTSKDSPYNSGHHTVEGSDYYDQRTLTGLYAILENGYPVTTGGFSDEQARYATANAIRFWCAENYCEGMPQYLNLNVNGDWIRGKYGYEDLYNWCLGLVQKARDQATSSPSTGSISFSPTSLTLTEDANGDYFVGSATVSKSISGSYGLSHNLPDGSSITGYSGNSGDRLSIQIPTSYGEQSFTITAYGSHSANTAKLFFWQPDAYNQQRVVTCVLDTDSTYVEANMTVITPKATPKNGSIQLTKGGLSPSSLRQYKNIILQTLNEAVKNGMLQTNPCQFVELPKKQRYESSYYSADQLKTLFDAIRDDPIYPLVKITALYGLRRSEVLGLKWDSVDFTAGRLTIKHTVSKVTTTVCKDKTKNSSSHRSFPLSPEAREIFIQAKTEEAINRKLCGADYEENDFIFKWPNGTPFSPDYVSSHFSLLLKNNHLPHIRFHELRHSCASLLLNNGFTLKDVQEYMGHADIQMTANIYGHLNMQRKELLTQKMASSLF